VRGGLTGLALAGAVLLLMLLALAGCGDNSASVSSTWSGEEAPTRTLSEAQQARIERRRARREQLAIERTFVPNPYPRPGASRPHPHGKVTHLIVRDIVRGHGQALRGDEIVYADFVKTYWLNGKPFLTAWGPHRTAWLNLSAEAEGIRRGMVGLRPGGRRVIAIPRAIADVHPPDGSGGFVDARIDVVLRKIMPPPPTE
jgi:FKBP-type peptidyl-prolyl cis-trans isomerase